MLNNKIKILNKNIEIGGALFPADFSMISSKFLSSLYGSTPNQKIVKIYEQLTSESVSKEVELRLEKIEEIISLSYIDDDLIVADFSNNLSLSINELIIENRTFYHEICSMVAVIFTLYSTLVEEGYINENESINIASSYENYLLTLSLIICKKLSLNINVILLGSNSKNLDKEFIYIKSDNAENFTTFYNEFFEDFGVVLDEISSLSLIGVNNYFFEYEDDTKTVILSLNSPYLSPNFCLKKLTNKEYFDNNLAVKKLNEITCIEIPKALKIEDFNLKNRNSIQESDFLKLFNLLF
jgi:hypothetical protein